MENILEYFYELPRGKRHGQDSLFVKMACEKSKIMERLNETLTDAQKELLEAYFDADAQIVELIQFDRFRYGFHLGAHLMEEMIEGKNVVFS